MIPFLFVTVHKYLSQDRSLFYAHVTSGQSGTWPLAKLILVKIPFSGIWELANNIGVNLGLDSARCSLEDVWGAIDNTDGWRESRNIIIIIIIIIYAYHIISHIQGGTMKLSP